MSSEDSRPVTIIASPPRLEPITDPDVIMVMALRDFARTNDPKNWTSGWLFCHHDDWEERGRRSEIATRLADEIEQR